MSQTLFMSAANPLAILVRRTGRKRRQRRLRFPDPHAALDWCLARQATFVLVPGAGDPKLN